jgi:hypothetical protein
MPPATALVFTLRATLLCELSALFAAASFLSDDFLESADVVYYTRASDVCSAIAIAMPQADSRADHVQRKHQNSTQFQPAGDGRAYQTM